MVFESLNPVCKEHLRNLLYGYAKRISFGESQEVILLREIPVKLKRLDHICKKQAQITGLPAKQVLRQAIYDHEQNNVCPFSFPIQTKFDALLNYAYSLAFTELIKDLEQFDPCDLEPLQRAITVEIVLEMVNFLHLRQVPISLMIQWRELQQKCIDKNRC